MRGATARVTLAALIVAGSIIAQQLGLGFVTSVDPTQGQQGALMGNFLTLLGIALLFATDTHYLVIAALDDSYKIFSPGELMPSGDVALATRAFAGAFKIGLQLSAPFLVFGLVFNIGLGVLARLMPQMQVYCRQCRSAPLRLVGGNPQAEPQQDFSGVWGQANFRQAGSRELRQGTFQGSGARRGHDGGALAGTLAARRRGAARSERHSRDHEKPDAAIARRRDCHARTGRDRRLPVPVPAMV